MALNLTALPCSTDRAWVDRLIAMLPAEDHPRSVVQIGVRPDLLLHSAVTHPAELHDKGLVPRDALSPWESLQGLEDHVVLLSLHSEICQRAFRHPTTGGRFVILPEWQAGWSSEQRTWFTGEFEELAPRPLGQIREEWKTLVSRVAVKNRVVIANIFRHAPGPRPHRYLGASDEPWLSRVRALNLLAWELTQVGAEVLNVDQILGRIGAATVHAQHDHFEDMAAARVADTALWLLGCSSDSGLADGRSKMDLRGAIEGALGRVAMATQCMSGDRLRDFLLQDVVHGVRSVRVMGSLRHLQDSCVSALQALAEACAEGDESKKGSAAATILEAFQSVSQNKPVRRS